MTGERKAKTIQHSYEILHPPNDLDRQQQILLALGGLYGLTIPQVMELWGWNSYPRTTELFKRITYDAKEKTIYPKKEELIYRLRRHGLGKDTIAGDVYFLLNAGAEKLRNDIEGCAPTFHFELNKAKLLRPGGLEHTLLLNEVLIKLKLFADSVPGRLRLEAITHERSMRNAYKDAFSLYPDGFIRFLIKQGNKWNHRCLFLELEHTSAHDKEKWIAKVRSYINLFQYKLGTYFQTDRIFVLVLVTELEYVRHLRNLTERTLEEMGTEALTYRN